MVRKEVRFSDKVSVKFLPFEERQSAWEARHGPYVCAPKHDELWDGTAKAFRPKPLTTAELKRLRSDKRVQKVLPSSIFALYKRHRKKLPEEGRTEEKEKENEEKEATAASSLRRVESAPALPSAPDSLIERLTRTATGLFFSDAQFTPSRPAEKPLVGILKKPKEPTAAGASVASGSGGASKRFSLSTALLRGSTDYSAQRRGSPMFMLGSSLEDSGAGEGEAKVEDDEEETGSFDSADLADGVKWLESVQKLDGLSNTKVQRSLSVQTTWEQLEEQWEILKQLGQALIWDGQAKLNEVWPQNPLGALMDPPPPPTSVH
jgi:hypothetical protein